MASWQSDEEKQTQPHSGPTMRHTNGTLLARAPHVDLACSRVTPGVSPKTFLGFPAHRRWVAGGAPGVVGGRTSRPRRATGEARRAPVYVSDSRQNVSVAWVMMEP
jgi:hypothetical protein